jgi:hypothetical protein
MSDPISAATAIIGLARTLSELLAKIKDKAVRDALQDSIFRIREEALRLQEENATLRDENRRLKEGASERVDPADYSKKGNAVWKDDVPFCMRCMDDRRKALRLVQPNEYSSQGRCFTCNGVFDGVFPERRLTRAPFVVRDDGAPFPQ